MNIINKKIQLADGRVIEIETGKLAKQAAGSAVVKMGGTMLLATVTAATEVKEGTDFMPLTVDYKEKFYAAGRFPGLIPKLLLWAPSRTGRNLRIIMPLRICSFSRHCMTMHRWWYAKPRLFILLR